MVVNCVSVLNEENPTSDITIVSTVVGWSAFLLPFQINWMIREGALIVMSQDMVTP